MRVKLVFIVVVFQLGQWIRDYKSMQTVDERFCTAENRDEMLEAVKQLTELDDEYKDNLGLTLKVTKENSEGKITFTNLVSFLITQISVVNLFHVIFIICRHHGRSQLGWRENGQK